jgi:DNA-binding NarL/FixJ family response regulator
MIKKHRHIKETTGYVNRVSRIKSMELSPRETQILHMMARCIPIEEVADHLGISPRTVEKHVENIGLKIGIRTYIGIARYAIENGYGKGVCEVAS